MAHGSDGGLVHTGAYAGDDLETYLDAARSSREQNITIVPPLRKVVALMREDEYYSTWVANKAVYRTRMAIAGGGALLIIAPGLKRFGEQEEVDALIRKYGYCGTERVINLWRGCPEGGDLKDLAHGTAHLIHGSSEGRFTITCAPGFLSEKDARSVGYNYADLKETLKRYDPAVMKDGINVMPDGEEVYFVGAPAAGLWSTKEKAFAHPEIPVE
jgi:nickel-dependent lactate racemase